uniref:Uncharacterized protein n=1 Tax=Anguilla anguilla TaxID=7936 RepID=A0A0E9UQC0_ANGAN
MHVCWDSTFLSAVESFTNICLVLLMMRTIAASAFLLLMTRSITAGQTILCTHS